MKFHGNMKKRFSIKRILRGIRSKAKDMTDLWTKGGRMTENLRDEIKASSLLAFRDSSMIQLLVMLTSLQIVRRRTALTRRANIKNEIIRVKHLYYSTHWFSSFHYFILVKSEFVKINFIHWNLILNIFTHSTINLFNFHGIFSSIQIMMTVALIDFTSIHNCVCIPL